MINRASCQLRRTPGVVAHFREPEVSVMLPATTRSVKPPLARHYPRHKPAFGLEHIDRAASQRLAQIKREIEVRTVDCRPIPYVDWEQGLTADGGYRIRYKDIDPSLLIKIGRFTGWCLSMCCFVVVAATNPHIFAKEWAPLHLLVAGFIFWLIWRGPTYVFRSIEVRPDCLVLDDTDVFWAEFMELGPPMLEWDLNRQKATIAVTYGNRWVELITSHRLDKFDRTPELLQAKLQWAFGQLWYRNQAKRNS